MLSKFKNDLCGNEKQNAEIIKMDNEILSKIDNSTLEDDVAVNVKGDTTLDITKVANTTLVNPVWQIYILK